MAKTNRPGSSDDSGFVRRTLAAASLVTALSGAANAQGNKAPDAPESESQQVVQTVKDRAGAQLNVDTAGIQLANDLGLGFSEDEIRKINEGVGAYSSSVKGNGYSGKSENRSRYSQSQPAETKSVFQSDSLFQSSNSMKTVVPSPQFSFSTDDGARIGGSVDPNTGAVAANYESAGKYRADFGLLRNMGTIRDTRIKASFQTLYAASQLGTYIGVEKGSELSKYVISQGFKVEGGKVQVTGALLKKLTEVQFAEVGVTEKPELTQKSIGVDYTRGFSKESILQELKTSVVYYDVDGKNLGTIGHIVVDTPTLFEQTRVDGGIRGGKKLLAELGTVIKITDTVRADLSLGAEHIRYDAMFDTQAKSRTSATGGLGLTYQPSRNDKFSIKGRASQSSTEVGVKYEHDFGNGVSAFVEAGRRSYSTGIESENRVLAGINIALGANPGKAPKSISPLYTDWSDKTALTLSDLNPNPLVATDSIQVMERVIHKEREIKIDKTVLPGDSFLEYKKDKNGKNVLEALDIDTGASNLVSVSSSNLPSPYSGYLSVSGGRFLRISNLEQFAKIAPVTANVSLADNVGTFTVVAVGIQKGSAVIGSIIERLSGVSPADAAAFVAGTKTIAQIIAGNANTAPTLSDVTAQTVNEDGSVTVNVTVGDAQTASGALVFAASSSNTSLFPNGSIVLGGSGANRTIVLSPAANVSGSATITYVVTDAGGLNQTKSFVITVNAVNDAPVFSAAQPPLAATQSSLLAPTVLPVATDIDSPSLTYSVSPLPAGLSFDAATRTISGTPTAGAGTYPITYTVTDGALSATQTFNIVVNSPANSAPTVSTAPTNVSVGKNQPAVSNIVVGDAEQAPAALIVTATSSNTALVANSNIVVTAGAGGARTITATPTAGATGSATINYVVSDGTLSTSGSYVVTYTNAAPVISSSVTNQSFVQNSLISPFVLPVATDSDSGETVTYSVSSLPAGLSFDPATRTISGTPTGTGPSTITYTATDASGAADTKTFDISISAAETPPILAAIPAQSPKTGVAFTLNLASSTTQTDGDAVTYAITAGSLPTGLLMNTSTGAITGTPTAVGPFSVTVVATDNDGNSTPQTISFNVTDGIAPNQPTITAGYETLTNANSVAVEVNGEVGASVWVNGTNTGSVIAANGKATVNLDTSGADGVKNFSIVLKDADSNPSTAASVSITADRTPAFISSVDHVSHTHNSVSISYSLTEAGTVYYLVVPNGSPSPDASTVRSTGTPIAVATAETPATVTINGLSPSTNYTVYFAAKDTLGNAHVSSMGTVGFSTSAAPNTAPSIVSAPSATYSVAKNNSSSANLTVDDTESGAASVTVTATSSNQSIVKDANVVVSAGAGGARTITVTPESGATGTVTVNYVLNDGTTTTNGSYTVTFTNSAPVISSTISNQSYDQGVSISNLVLPVATDPDSGETVTYSVSSLPTGLSFDAATRTISGTPTAGAGTYPITYTATDGSGATDVKTFNIVISANVAPTIEAYTYWLDHFMGMSYTQPYYIDISDTGTMTVTLTANEGGRYVVNDSLGGTVTGNNTSSVTITGAASGRLAISYTSPSTYQSGMETLSVSVTDSGGLTTSVNNAYFY